ncbi:MAG TPA: hypothetical protein VL126_14730 [Bacteroidota bacterium]|nr:hypothetical protein [Bacteroidota bacterium]
MSIRGIESEFAPVEPVKGKKSSTPAKASPGASDKVQVSGEAKSLFQADQSKRIEEIRKRLDDGYYLTPEVTDKIVDGLMNDLLKSA